jgi:putative nucleotidyltransferase with HDIG domain
LEADIKDLLPEIDHVEDPDLRAGCARVWARALERGGWSPSDLNRMPFTLLLPHEVGVSLLDHTRTVTRLCLAAYDLLDSAGGVSLHRDHLLAGALLHDVGKVVEMHKVGDSFTKSPQGKLIRHPFSGAALCLEEGLPDEVAHIVALHAKEGDHGRRTPEATLVHYADFLAFETLKSSLGL